MSGREDLEAAFPWVRYLPADLAHRFTAEVDAWKTKAEDAAIERILQEKRILREAPGPVDPVMAERVIAQIKAQAAALGPEGTEILATLAAHDEWVAAGRPGALTHEEATAELLREGPQNTFIPYTADQVLAEEHWPTLEEAEDKAAGRIDEAQVARARARLEARLAAVRDSTAAGRPGHVWDDAAMAAIRGDTTARVCRLSTEHLVVMMVTGRELTLSTYGQLDEVAYDAIEPLGRVRPERDDKRVEVVGRHKESGALVKSWAWVGAMTREPSAQEVTDARPLGFAGSLSMAELAAVAAGPDTAVQSTHPAQAEAELARRRAQGDWMAENGQDWEALPLLILG